VFRIIDADIVKGIHAAMVGDELFFVEQRDTLEETVGFFITQGGARRSLLTPIRLTEMLHDAGFPHVFVQHSWQTMGSPWIKDLDSRHEESFCVEAVR
jgi:hypothetical protein